MAQLTEREEKFLAYWKENRQREKKLTRQLLFGLPLGLVFVIPILLNFFSGWYKRANMWARGHEEDSTGGVLLVAGLIIIVFIAIFSKRHRWEQNEQTYRELEARRARDGGIPDDAAKVD